MADLIEELVEAGVHFGHQSRKWNPKMKQYIYGEKNSVHIIDLSQTLELLNKASIEIHKSVPLHVVKKLPVDFNGNNSIRKFNSIKDIIIFSKFVKFSDLILKKVFPTNEKAKREIKINPIIPVS